jgi:hypothetical protein
VGGKGANLEHVVVQVGVGHHAAGECAELVAGRQATVEEEVCSLTVPGVSREVEALSSWCVRHLHEGRLLRQLLDWDATVRELALV